MFQSSNRTSILGIINVTPDSFSDGGLCFDPHDSAAHALAMLDAGADFIDVGAVSTRPGASCVSAQEEIERLVPALKKMLTVMDASHLCVDANSPNAIRWALSMGVRMFNLCGGLPWNMNLRRQLHATESSMIVYPRHPSCPAQLLITGRQSFFETQQALSKEVGISAQKLLLDPGMGFGIDAVGSAALLHGFAAFKTLGHPLGVGVSRKNHLARFLGREPSATPYAERIEAGLAATAVAIFGGATYVRTHDVLPTKRFLTALDAIRLTT